MTREAAKSRSNTKEQNARSPKLYSVHTLLRHREFVGEFENRHTRYRFSYTPTRVGLESDKSGVQGIAFQGTVTIIDSAGKSRSRQAVRATLLSTQGGLGNGPARGREDSGANGSNGSNGNHISTSTQIPTDNTGPTSFVGVMYLRLSPLDGKALGVAMDLTGVQLNVRFFTIDPVAQGLHRLYSSLIDAVLGEHKDAAAAKTHLEELNRLLQEA